MPKGPKGQERPADVIGSAIRVAKIATGSPWPPRPKLTPPRSCGQTQPKGQIPIQPETLPSDELTPGRRERLSRLRHIPGVC